MKIRAIVQTAPRTLDLRELPLPEIGPDDALPKGTVACRIIEREAKE